MQEFDSRLKTESFGADMERNGLLLPDKTEAESVLWHKLRPQEVKDFVGQKDVVEGMKIATYAALERAEVLEHVLLSGPPGLGKTTLAGIIANIMGTRFVCTAGPAIERVADIVGLLTSLRQKDVLFIDEIHRLPRVVEEFIYPAMDSYQIDFVMDKGPYARTIKLNLKPFTLIGATTRSGLLTSPLRDRFGLYYHLDFYPPEELCKIIMRSADLLSLNITPEGALSIAKRSRGTPRIANRLLRRVRDWAQVAKKVVVDKEISDQALMRLGIDNLGLDRLDKRVLETIINNYNCGPVGIESLAAALGEETDTLEDVVEPYLLKIGFIQRSSRGRIATDLACQHLEE